MFLDIFGINVYGVYGVYGVEGRGLDSYNNLLSHVQPHNIVHLMLLFTHLHLLQGALHPHFTNSRHSLLASPWEIHCGSQCELGSSRFQPKSEGDGRLCWSCKDVAQAPV